MKDVAMDILIKSIHLADFWYCTDYDNFKIQFDTIQEAISSAQDCIENNLERTIEIIKQDIEEVDDNNFTFLAEAMIKELKGE